MRKQFSLRTIMISVALAAIAMFILICGTRKLHYEIVDHYAQLDAAVMIIDHMETHGGTWPRNWDALKPWFESKGGRTGWPFELYASRIFIDFDADVDELRAAALSSNNPTFDVVHAKYKFRLSDIGPNSIIHSYFRGSASETITDPDSIIK